MDYLKWYLKPANQNVTVDIDDLHQEIIMADAKLDWGFDYINKIKLNKEIRIAIVDGGVDIEHPDLKDIIYFNKIECFNENIIPPMSEAKDLDHNGYVGDCVGWNFVNENNRVEDEDGHGTHVSGIIASIIGKHRTKVKIIPLKVFAPNEGRAASQSGIKPLTSRLIDAFKYAINMKVDIIHISAGWPKNYMTLALSKIITEAIDKKIMIVTAAGNSSQRSAVYPCQIDGVVCVGALRANGAIARFSNVGNQVDLFAFGEQILNAIPQNLIPQHISIKNYDYKNGTSQAAPFITALISLLKSSFPAENNQETYARMMDAADRAPEYAGQRGMFNLTKAFDNKPSHFIHPNLKGIHTVLINNDRRFSFSIPLVNYSASPVAVSPIKIDCKDANATLKVIKNTTIEPFKNSHALIEGQLKSIDLQDLRCFLNINEKKTPLVLKVVTLLPKAELTALVEQDERIISISNNQARSRLLTIPALNGAQPEPLYKVVGAVNFKVMRFNKFIGEIIPNENCRVLRAWQIDLDGDLENDIFMEYLCEQKFIQYRFFAQDLMELYEPVTFSPNLTVVNYSDFEMITNKDAPPSIRFINVGYGKKPISPWDDDTSEDRLPHLYRLDPIKKNGKFEYITSVLDDPGRWSKSLGLLYTPGYNIYYIFDNKMLVDLNQKYAWVDLLTQNATWAQLDQLLLKGSHIEVIQLTNEVIFQSLLTPLQYRGAIKNKTTLRYTQNDVHDPIFQIIGTIPAKEGYESILRTYRYLLYLKYDFQGLLVEENRIPIDRFDFITSQDMMATVNHINHQGDSYQIIDGTNINTNYVDVIKNGIKQSFQLPASCVSNMPVNYDHHLYLPIYCYKDDAHFQMDYILLSR